MGEKTVNRIFAKQLAEEFLILPKNFPASTVSSWKIGQNSSKALPASTIKKQLLQLADRLNTVYTLGIMYLNPRIRRILALGLLFAFLGNGLVLPPAYTDVGAISNRPYMPAPGIRIALSPPFNPAVLKGMVINPKDPFKFDFIVDKGDEDLSASPQDDAAKRNQYTQLIKYFLAAPIRGVRQY